MHDDPLIRKTFRYRWLVFWTLALGYVLVYFHRLCPAVVAVDMMADLEAGGTLLGILGSAYFYPYAVMQLPAGLLADSWGPRRTITLFFLVACAGSLLLGLAPTVFWAVTGRMFVGLGVSMLFVPTMKVLAEWFEAREFAFMTGILMAMGGVGTFASTKPPYLAAGVFYRPDPVGGPVRDLPWVRRFRQRRGGDRLHGGQRTFPRTNRRHGSGPGQSVSLCRRCRCTTAARVCPGASRPGGRPIYDGRIPPGVCGPARVWSPGITGRPVHAGDDGQAVMRPKVYAASRASRANRLPVEKKQALKTARPTCPAGQRAYTWPTGVI